MQVKWRKGIVCDYNIPAPTGIGKFGYELYIHNLLLHPIRSYRTISRHEGLKRGSKKAVAWANNLTIHVQKTY